MPVDGSGRAIVTLAPIVVDDTRATAIRTPSYITILGPVVPARARENFRLAAAVGAEISERSPFFCRHVVRSFLPAVSVGYAEWFSTNQDILTC